jgi:hypothetical protein
MATAKGKKGAFATALTDARGMQIGISRPGGPGGASVPTWLGIGTVAIGASTGLGQDRGRSYSQGLAGQGSAEGLAGQGSTQKSSWFGSRGAETAGEKSGSWMPSLPKFSMPGMPKMPGMPGMPRMPGMPTMPSMSGVGSAISGGLSQAALALAAAKSAYLKGGLTGEIIIAGETVVLEEDDDIIPYSAVVTFSKKYFPPQLAKFEDEVKEMNTAKRAFSTFFSKTVDISNPLPDCRPYGKEIINLITQGIRNRFSDTSRGNSSCQPPKSSTGRGECSCRFREYCSRIAH